MCCKTVKTLEIIYDKYYITLNGKSERKWIFKIPE